MSHLDEGTLHALLDGELDNASMQQIQTHLGKCAACGSRLAEVKELRAEADRLVASLEPPPSAGASAPPRSPAPPPIDVWSEPVLLIPDPTDVTIRRQRWSRALGWAAVLLIAAGAGYIANDVRRQNEIQQMRLRGLEAADARPAAPTATLSEEEAPAPRPAAPAPSRAESARAEPQQAERQEAPPPPAEPQRAERQAEEPRQPPPAEAPRTELAKRAAPESAAGAGTRADTPFAAAPDADSLDEDAQRLRDAAATADLDRQRITRERAAAAAAERARRNAQPPAPRGTVAAAPGAATAPESAARPAPVVRPIEERAQVYLRIGLDEAARQLGSPMHVIEGMYPELVGLAQGRVSPGMDVARPVVRVVYRDALGRLVFLDQQRVRSGQTPGPATALRWTIGDILVSVHGEPAEGVLRNLARRVR